MSQGKQVIVTGAARGLGRAIVDSLVERGWEVWATDTLTIKPTETRAQHQAIMDVAEPESVSAVVDKVVAGGGLAALVNNAAITPLMDWDELDLETWRRAIDVNLTGTFICSQLAGRAMRDAGKGGAIVNIASVTFFQGHPTGLHYTASKGGVIGLSRSFARVLGPAGIRVNVVAPGIMRTEGVLEQVERGIIPGERINSEHDPLRFLPGRTEPKGVADVVRFLLSDDAREITGQTLVASGGTFLY